MTQPEPALDFDHAGTQATLTGRWTTARLSRLESRWDSLAWPRDRPVRVMAQSIDAMDTAGAWFLERVLAELSARDCPARLEGLGERHTQLLELVRQQHMTLPAAPEPLGPVEGTGAYWLRGAGEAIDFLSFVGQTALATLRAITNLSRLRPRAIVAQIEAAGLRALGVVGLLTFLIGVVMAYQGGTQLSQLGANIFLVELVTVATARELGPLIAAIVVAGRTGSAYAAELASMKVGEEIDALRAMGSDPLGVLVVPRLLGLMIALPLVTVFADVTSVAGGMLVSAALFGVSTSDFVARIPVAVSLTSFGLGLLKTPVFALIIAAVGCFHGFQAMGSSTAVGRRTTVSVVHGIFGVIVADAVFSVAFNWLGV